MGGSAGYASALVSRRVCPRAGVLKRGPAQMQRVQVDLDRSAGITLLSTRALPQISSFIVCLVPLVMEALPFVDTPRRARVVLRRTPPAHRGRRRSLLRASVRSQGCLGLRPGGSSSSGRGDGLCTPPQGLALRELSPPSTIQGSTSRRQVEECSLVIKRVQSRSDLFASSL